MGAARDTFFVVLEKKKKREKNGEKGIFVARKHLEQRYINPRNTFSLCF
jgi:hypothetical protein